MYVAVLLFVYYLWEADAKEEEKGPSLTIKFSSFSSAYIDVVNILVNNITVA